MYIPEYGFIIDDNLLFVVFVLEPKFTGRHKVRFNSAFGTRFDDFVLVRFGRAPFANAIETKHMITIFQNAESPFGKVLLFPDNLHANAAYFFFATLHGERLFHVFFDVFHALFAVLFLLFKIERIQTRCLTQVTQVAVNVLARVFERTLELFLEIRTQMARTGRRRLIVRQLFLSFNVINVVFVEHVQVGVVDVLVVELFARQCLVVRGGRIFRISIDFHGLWLVEVVATRTGSG